MANEAYLTFQQNNKPSLKVFHAALQLISNTVFKGNFEVKHENYQYLMLCKVKELEWDLNFIFEYKNNTITCRHSMNDFYEYILNKIFASFNSVYKGSYGTDEGLSSDEQFQYKIYSTYKEYLENKWHPQGYISKVIHWLIVREKIKSLPKEWQSI